MAVSPVNEQSFEKEVLQNSGYALVDFWAEWCMPCKRLMPILDAVSEQNLNVRFVKVNVDENPSLASTYNIRAIPTLILLKNGEVVATKNGGLPAVELNEWIKTNIK
ncbi:MAG: thioredoxin [Proteobacteria bacterium]|jgi:thioredoxin 1|nr:thioredoxin [Pseudomonadota bacterium]